MSASSKKKLRNEQSAEKMTQRQEAEQKEAKKLKTYTTVFCVVIALLLAIAIGVTAYRAVTRSGIIERKTVAATVGSHSLTAAELNYFYVDAVNNFANQYGSYLPYVIDTTKPLDEMVIDPTTGTTWADYFTETAMNDAASVYAVVDAANAAGYTLSAEELAAIDTQFANLDIYYQAYGYSNLDGYLKSIYGNGATAEGYRDYLELRTLAESYYAAYAESLSYDDAALRAADAENAINYNSYTFNYYYINVADYYEGGTTDEAGNITYSDEEKEAARAAAEADAVTLSGEGINSAENLDMMITRIAEDKEGAASVLCEDYRYSSILTLLQDWVSDDARVEGEVTYIANESTTTAEDGTEVTTVSGYYVVMFVGCNDNNYPLANVRHILIPYEGGTMDPTTYATVYSDEEKAAAEDKATALLAEWEAGDATEDSFAALANTNSSDSDGTDGGLYTDVYPGQMVTNFNDWCFEDGRKAGDTGIVHSEYGVHIMYYCGDSEILYRDFMIAEDLRTADLDTWFNGLVANYTCTAVNTDYVLTDLTLG